MKRGRATNRLHDIVRLKTKAAVEALLLCEHQVATRLGWSVHLKKSQSPEERAREQALKNGYSGVPVPRRGAAQSNHRHMPELTWRQQRSKGECNAAEDSVRDDRCCIR